MKKDLQVLETTKYVVERSRYIDINKDKIKELAENWAKEKIKIPGWNYDYHFFDNSWQTCEYLFVLDSLNFCFWSKEPADKWRIKYQNSYLDGYFALSYSLKKAVEEGLIEFAPDFIAKMSYRDFGNIFAGRGALPFLKERFRILKENYKILDRKYDGKFINLIDKCRGNAIELALEVVKNFPSFRDEAMFNGRKIRFYKRAQILAGDLYASFGNRKWGKLKNLDKLTIFADYKIPQILRGHGILEYSRDLAKKVDNKKIISAGSREEVEIRANAIWAVEFLKQEFKKKGIKLRSFEIDWILWNKAQKDDIKLKPYHLTKTIYY